MDEIMQTLNGNDEIKKYAHKIKEEDDIQILNDPPNPQMRIFSQFIPQKNPESDEISL